MDCYKAGNKTRASEESKHYQTVMVRVFLGIECLKVLLTKVLVLRRDEVSEEYF